MSNLIDNKPSERPRRRIAGVLLHCIGLLIFIWLMLRADWQAIGQTFKNINWRYFLLSIILFLPMLGIKAQRFRLLVRSVLRCISYRYAFSIYLAAYFLGTITPGRLGELAKAYYLKQRLGVSMVQSLQPTLLDRLFDLVVLSVFGLIGWIMLSGVKAQNIGFSNTIVLGILVIAILAGLFLGRSLLALALRLNFLKGKVARLTKGVKEMLDVFCTRLGGVCVLLTILAYMIGFFQAYLIARSIGIDISYWEFSMLMAAICLAMLLPISISGFGTREAAAVFLFGLYGVSAETALSFSFLYFLVVFLLGGLQGAVCWLITPIGGSRNLRKNLCSLRESTSDIGGSMVGASISNTEA